jgi:hypothetical protein
VWWTRAKASLWNRGREKERKKNFERKGFELFCYRTRYFSDAGILGSKEFVREVFDQVKHLLTSKDARRFTSLAEAEGAIP